MILNRRILKHHGKESPCNRKSLHLKVLLQCLTSSWLVLKIYHLRKKRSSLIVHVASKSSTSSKSTKKITRNRNYQTCKLPVNIWIEKWTAQDSCPVSRVRIKNRPSSESQLYSAKNHSQLYWRRPLTRSWMITSQNGHCIKTGFRSSHLGKRLVPRCRITHSQRHLDQSSNQLLNNFTWQNCLKLKLNGTHQGTLIAIGLKTSHSHSPISSALNSHQVGKKKIKRANLLILIELKTQKCSRSSTTTIGRTSPPM